MRTGERKGICIRQQKKEKEKKQNSNNYCLKTVNIIHIGGIGTINIHFACSTDRIRPWMIHWKTRPSRGHIIIRVYLCAADLSFRVRIIGNPRERSPSPYGKNNVSSWGFLSLSEIHAIDGRWRALTGPTARQRLTSAVSQPSSIVASEQSLSVSAMTSWVDLSHVSIFSHCAVRRSGTCAADENLQFQNAFISRPPVGSTTSSLQHYVLFLPWFSIDAGVGNIVEENAQDNSVTPTSIST